MAFMSTDQDLTTAVGSRRLITYSRLSDEKVSAAAVAVYHSRKTVSTVGSTVDDLNPFRRGYFKKFET